MRRKPILALCTLALAVMIVSPVVIQASNPHWFPTRMRMGPIVSPRWLRHNLWRPNLVILDVRGEGYDDGHIPGAIHSIPFVHWVINPPGPDWPWLELPEDEALFTALGNHGITKKTHVVIVGTTSGPMPFGLYNNADPTRVAMTLIYAGVKKVAILNGGFEAWVSKGYAVTTDVPEVTPVTYDGKVKEMMFVSTEYVNDSLGKSILIDGRDKVVYDGDVIEPWPPIPTAGHIPTARNLPTPELWNVVFNEDGSFVESASYKSVHTLRKMARDIIGRRGFGGRRCYKEIIVYCGVGGYASTVFFVLSEVLGYRNVKVYDGSWQVWSSNPELPVE